MTDHTVKAFTEKLEALAASVAQMRQQKYGLRSLVYAVVQSELLLNK